MEHSYTHLFYLVSFACNERCSKCSHWKTRPIDKPLPTELLSDAFHALPRLVEFCIVGGEPLIFRPAIRALVDAARSHSFRTVLVTNGVLLTEDFVRDVADARIHIVVSIDTLDRAQWQWVRGRDTYDTVLDNLRRACAVLTPEQISVQSVLAAETVASIPAVRALCSQLGIHHSVQDYISDGFDGHWTPLPSGERAVSADSPCIAAGRNISILPNGDVVSCFQQSWISGCERPLGNLRDSSMAEILESEYAEDVQKAMWSCDLPCKALRCNQT